MKGSSAGKTKKIPFWKTTLFWAAVAALTPIIAVGIQLAFKGNKGDASQQSNPAIVQPGPSPAADIPLAPTPAPTDKGNPSVKVWVNTDPKSGIYHCPGSKWYKNTKQGEYMTQKQAQDIGYRPAYGKVCQ
jgi:hypothetical protein